MSNRFRPATALLPILLLAAGASAQKGSNLAALDALSHRYRAEAASKKAEAQSLARVFGLPERVLQNGKLIELMEFRNGRPVYVQTDNVNAAITTRANRLHPGGSSGLGLTGSGVTLGIWDGGTSRLTHQELAGRVTRMDTEAQSGDHATHVSGTMIGAGVNASAKGMSFGANLHTYGWGNDTGEMATAAANGLVISNHSYGYITGWYHNGLNWYWYGDTAVSEVEDNGFGFYDGASQAYDNIAYNAPFYLICKSAGNDRNEGPAAGTSHYAWYPATGWTLNTTVRNRDGNGTGYDTVSYHGTAKNILTVAAVGDVLNYTGPGSVGMSSFSGWGPTDDGRIKPDISANGVSLLSSIGSGDASYASFSGTSMSTPNTSGSLGLLVQHFRNLNPFSNMRSSTLKGLVIHTADEAGSSMGPDYAFGWGLLNVDAAASVISEDVGTPSTITENWMDNGVTATRTVYSDGTEPLKVTICWTDVAGTSPAWSLDPTTRMLVNDLDIRVTNGATTYMPWILNPAIPNAAATTGDNFRDNVEQIYIAAPTAGFHTITIGHKGTIVNATQPYSLIVTGGTTAPVPAELSDLTLAASSVEGGASTSGAVTMTNTAGGTVDIASDSASISVPASVTVPSGSSTGSFGIGTSAVATTTTGTITASRNAVTVTRTLEVRAPEPSALVDMTLAATTVAGGSSTSGTVTLSNTNGGSVDLSTDSVAITIATNITVANGASSASFSVDTTPVSATTLGSITASRNGVSITRSLEVRAAALSSFGINPTSVIGGTGATGTVGVTGAVPAGGISIALADDSSAASTPASVNVPGGSAGASFSIATSAVASATVANVTATFEGVTMSTPLTIQPQNQPELSSLTVNPVSVFEGQNATGTVGLTMAGPSAVSVSLTEVGSSSTILPGSVTVAAGSTSASFTIGTASNIGSVAVTRTIRASYNGVTRDAALQIKPIVPISVTSTPTTIKGGQSATGRVTLNAAAGSGGCLVTLTDTSTFTSVPASVTVPAGATSATFTITTTRPQRKTETSIIRATRNGVTVQVTVTVQK